MSLKPLLWLGTLLFAVPIGPPEATRPAPRCNAILLHTPDSAAFAIRTLARQFLAGGYGLKQLDKQSGYLLTEPKAVAPDVRIVVQAVVTPASGGSVIVFQGTYQWGPANAADNEGGRGNTLIAYRAPGNKPARAAWEGLAQAAVYPGAKPSYRKQR